MINIKEEFLSSVKTKRAWKMGGSDAILLWLNLRAYVAEGNTGGFIPKDAIEDLPLIPKKWERAMRALIGCGKTKPDGTKGAGLVHETAFGYELHDYEDHGTMPEVEDERRRKAREQKRARRLILRHQRGDCPDDCPHCTPDIVRGQGSDSPPDRDTGPPPRARGRAPVREREAQPSPAQPSPKEKDPPLPPRDRFGATFRPIRDDVLELHAAWRRTFGLDQHKLSGPTDRNAEDLAAAIDADGLAACHSMLAVAKLDGMVNGTADKGNKHEQIRYVFGNPDTRARLLRLVRERERPTGKLSAVDAARRARDLEPDAGDP